MAMFINTGSTMLNLALTGKVDGGWPLGRMSNVIGDKSTGKTLLAIEAATMFLNFPPPGIKPKVIYIEAEAAFDQDYAASLGMPVDQVEFPEGIDTIEGVFKKIEDILDKAKANEGYLLIVDSMDSLSSDAEMARDMDAKSYGMEKQKKLGELFRKKVRALESSKVHVMILSQVRENIDAMPFSPKFRRSGGKALDFYATHLVWLAEVEKLKNAKTGMVYGITCKAKTTKNKVAKPFRDVEFPILFAYGVDNICSMILYLDDPKMPKGIRIDKLGGGYFQLNETSEKMRLEELTIFMENNKAAYQDLIKRCQSGWDWYEDETKVNRRSKTDIMTENK